MLYGCKKQNEPEALVLQKPFPEKNSEEYYANLRAFKRSKHQISFGWFTGFGSKPGGSTPIMAKRMESLPDSIDIVSLFAEFGNVPSPGSTAHETMKEIQQKKGTRFVVAIFGSGMDRLRLKNFPDLPVLEGIDAVAKSLVDSINKYELDGFDLDYEPHYGDDGIFGHGPKDKGGDIYTQRLFKALSAYLGPKSGTGKLLIIDGENEPGIEPYIDYLCQQAYSASGPSDLQGRYLRFGFNRILPTEKFVPCEWVAQINPNYIDPVHGKMPSTYGMAYWQPMEGIKGGAGLYGPQDNYDDKDPFRIMRNMIQIMNPAVR
jgi:hypothetical protein